MTSASSPTATPRDFSDGGWRLTEHNCAIREVAERFPEVCAAEQRFLASVLGGTVERRSHMLEGCGGCEYKVQFPQENV